jgi:hypothetical protein
MEKVTVKAQSEIYNGMMFGFQFFNGFAYEVPMKHADYMVKNFGVEIVKPEQPVKKDEPKAESKPKKAPRKKAGE